MEFGSPGGLAAQPSAGLRAGTAVWGVELLLDVVVGRCFLRPKWTQKPRWLPESQQQVSAARTCPSVSRSEEFWFRKMNCDILPMPFRLSVISAVS